MNMLEMAGRRYEAIRIIVRILQKLPERTEAEDLILEFAEELLDDSEDE